MERMIELKYYTYYRDWYLPFGFEHYQRPLS